MSTDTHRKLELSIQNRIYYLLEGFILDIGTVHGL